MDETLIRGLIVGGALGAVALAASLVWKAIKSPSEGARRFRIVAGIGLGALVLFVAAESGALIEILVFAAVVGAIIWVIKGTKK